MTREEAKAEQDQLAEHYDLGFWFGTKCKPCCGVFPKFRTLFQGAEMRSGCQYLCRKAVDKLSGM